MTKTNNELTIRDIRLLNRCLALAEEALLAGDQPFGSILVSNKGEILAEARNRINKKNILAHPEIELSNWALEHLTKEERQKSTMYTSGEHCTMCAAAHGWAEIGGLIYLSSAQQLKEWLSEFGVPSPPIYFYPIQKIIKTISVKGPAEGKLLEKIKDLHYRYYKKRIPD